MHRGLACNGGMQKREWAICERAPGTLNLNYPSYSRGDTRALKRGALCAAKILGCTFISRLRFGLCVIYNETEAKSRSVCEWKSKKLTRKHCKVSEVNVLKKLPSCVIREIVFIYFRKRKKNRKIIFVTLTFTLCIFF